MQSPHYRSGNVLVMLARVCFLPADDRQRKSDVMLTDWGQSQQDTPWGDMLPLTYDFLCSAPTPVSPPTFRSACTLMLLYGLAFSPRPAQNIVEYVF